MREPVAPEADAGAESPTAPRPARTIFRSELERALARGPGYLMAQLGPEPFRLDGQFVGWEITRVFPDDPDLCESCDLHVGDVILSVAGDPLQTPQALTGLLERLPTLPVLEVTRLRDQQREEVRYSLVEDRTSVATSDDSAAEKEGGHARETR